MNKKPGTITQLNWTELNKLLGRDKPYPPSYYKETPKGMSRNVWFIAIAAVLIVGGYLLYRK
jgi:hypothetical protein